MLSKIIKWTPQNRIGRVVLLCLLCTCPVFIYFLLNFECQDSRDVEGWGANVSRSLPLYISPNTKTALIPCLAPCSAEPSLLIVVCSAVSHFAERMVIRQTWGRFPEKDFRIVFLLGRTHNSSVQETVSAEFVAYGDTIQEDFMDSYNNLTLKSVMLLKTVINCYPDVPYILKSDDDMFIHVFNLLEIVRQLAAIHVSDILLGDFISGARPIRNSKSKWFAPRYMFAGTMYPDYLSGTSYLMDRSAATKLYQAALTTPLFYLEDIFITGICAEKANILRRAASGFSYRKRPLDPLLYKKSSFLISSHHLSVEDMGLVWRWVQEDIDRSS